jgi:heme/copper-type cytochrome/quinol oxidase subunit 1
MKKLMFKIATLSLLLVATPMMVQAETGWTIYKPGLVKSAITKGKTVLLGYLSSW